MVNVLLNGVTKEYDAFDASEQGGRQNALQGVSLDMIDGETLAVVGPSGCGKSTLLKIVAGLEFSTTGRIAFNDHDVTHIDPQERGVGMVFQDYALYPSMQGKGNLSYFFEVNKRSEDEAEQHMREVADVMGVGFEHLLGQMPTTLSGGEQQRVAIARCIVRRPTVFLMDEPICNLDAKLRERTRVEMKRLLRRYEVTTLYVTHDQQEAIFMGDRIAVMREGRVEQIGTFDDLYYSPINAFVAEFIGTPPMTQFVAEIQDQDVVIQGQSGMLARWSLPQSLISIATQHSNLLLGIRPEGWQIGQDNNAGATPLTVKRVERSPSTSSVVLHGMLGDSRVAVLTPHEPQDLGQVHLLPDWEQIHLFDKATGQAIHSPGVPELF
ncbi:MAG: ABC transporter ATP-binding protein [Chloroflexota bacterium]